MSNRLYWDHKKGDILKIAVFKVITYMKGLVEEIKYHCDLLKPYSSLNQKL